MYLNFIGLSHQRFYRILPYAVHIIRMSKINPIEENIRQCINSFESQPDIPASHQSFIRQQGNLIFVVPIHHGQRGLLTVSPVRILHRSMLQPGSVYGSRYFRFKTPAGGTAS